MENARLGTKPDIVVLVVLQWVFLLTIFSYIYKIRINITSLIQIFKDWLYQW